MRVPLSELKGITPAALAGLKAQGISDSETLLEKARTPQDRNALATASGVDPAMLLELANRADLARLKGVGRVYSDLLEEAGVDTVNELARRSAASLHDKLIDINSKRQLTQRSPSLEQIVDFVEQAKALPAILE
jgi:predicted flap endonuclease-1-like 5' DNA nuclease